jgi:hypothetical protein
MRLWIPVLLALWGAAGCAAEPAKSSPPRKDAGTGKVEVQIGTPDPTTGLDFVKLMPGGDIALETFGQGGTHATVAVRCIGFGSKAFVDVALENLDSDSGAQVMTVPSVRPQLLLCRDMNMQVCDLLPIHVMTGGLADPDKKDGLPVRVTATVHNDAGLMASASQDGVLRKSF